MPMKILVVEDESLVRESVVSALRPEGYEVEAVETGEEGLDRALTGNFALIVADIGLPRMDGWEMVAQLRKAGHSTPVIFLTAMDREEDIVKGLETGGDDYITKPFSVRELTARVRALLRRKGWESEAVLTRDNLTLDKVSRRLSWGESSVLLTDQESRILSVLMDRGEEPVSRPELLEKGLGYDFDPGTKVLDVHLASLRKKLRRLGLEPIKNLRGLGWRFSLK